MWMQDARGRVEHIDNIPHRLRHLWVAQPYKPNFSVDMSLWDVSRGTDLKWRVPGQEIKSVRDKRREANSGVVELRSRRPKYKISSIYRMAA